MALISRITTWISGQLLKSADLNGEFNNIVNTVNNLDSATTTWTNVKGATINATTALQVNGTTFTFTDWTSYTPTVVGLGTVSAVSFFWMQIANHVWVKGFLTTGTVTASAVTITVPSGKAINMSKTGSNFYLGISERLLSTASALHTAVNIINVFSDGADTANIYMTIHNGSNVFTKDSGSTLFNSADSLSIMFDYAI